MVLVALDHPHGSVDISAGPFGIVCYGVVAMAFLVSLVHNVESVVVIQGVHLGIVGIMAGTDDVHVVAFEEQNVAYHRLDRNSFAVLGMYVMTVGSLEIGEHSVDVNLVVAQFYLAETVLLCGGFGDIAGSVEHFHVESIKIRFLGTPQVGRRKVYLRVLYYFLSGRHSCGVNRCGTYFASVGIEKSETQSGI